MERAPLNLPPGMTIFPALALVLAACAGRGTPSLFRCLCVITGGGRSSGGGVGSGDGTDERELEDAGDSGPDTDNEGVFSLSSSSPAGV